MIRYALCSLALMLLLLAPHLRAQEELGKKGGKKIKIEWAPYKTKHYDVMHESVIPKAVVKRVADGLDEALIQYTKVFGFKPKKRLKVKFLDSLNTYEQEGGDPSHPGHYNPGSGYLVLRQRPYYQLIPTAYHEAFHQYLHEYIGEGTPIPTWFDEGMAMYFEGMQKNKRTKKQKLDYRLIDNRKIGMVKRAIFTRTAIPLEELIDASHEEFHDKKKESLHYTQSMAVIYFLMKGKGGRPVFQYAKTLQQTKDVEKANEKIFGKERKRLKALERQWKAYTARLKLDEGSRA